MSLPQTIQQLGVIERTALADGDVLVYDAARGQFVSISPHLKVFADAAARAATGPAFAGQLAVQLDTGRIYRGTSALAWTEAPPPPVVLVADATARGAAVPAFLGQLAVQLDTGGLYYGSALEAGGWTLVTATAAA